MLAVIGTLIPLCSAPAQTTLDPMIAGRHYVLTFPDTTRNVRDARFQTPRYEERWLVFVYSPIDTRYRISGNGISRPPMPLPGGRTTVLDMRSPDLAVGTIMTTEPVCSPRRNTVRIDADDPVIVYCFMSTAFGAEAWTPLPVEAWGTEYFAAVHPGETVGDISTSEFSGTLTKRPAPAEIVVVAAYDGTEVSIANTGPVVRSCTGGSFRLNAGEAVVVHSAVDTSLDEGQSDLAGTRITASHPVGVLSGNTRAKVIPEITSMSGNSTRNLLVEWLSPVEYHGTTFVYMPTWDSRRPTGAPDENLAEKRSAEIVRTYGTHDDLTTGSVSGGGGSTEYLAAIPLAGVYQTRHVPTEAVVHTTSSPSQVMMSTAAISVMRSSQAPPWGGWGGKFDTWAGYMVELVPRERWTSFAPLIAPTSPAGLEHYVNVVVDTAHRNEVYLQDGRRFPFSRLIAGTDLIWGSMPLSAGASMTLTGRNGARFGGFVYGTFVNGGREEFRPGAANGDDEPPTGTAPGDGSDGELLHPAEYEEWIGIAYGYPLASRHIVTGVSDSIKVDRTESTCGTTVLRLSVTNARAAGLHSVELFHHDNVRVARTDPAVLTGAVAADLVLEPIDARRDARAWLMIRSRTGESIEVPYTYTAPRVATSAEATDFGTLTTRERTTRTVRLTNPGQRPVTIDAIAAGPASPFTVSTPVSLPHTLQPGAGVDVAVTINAAGAHGVISDTLFTSMTCATFTHPLSAKIIAPEIRVDDLDLGTVTPGTIATGHLAIRNTSDDTLTLHAAVDSVIVWDNLSFGVAAEERAKLAGASIAPGSAVALPVTFQSTQVGGHAVIAHIRSNAVNGTGTATWSARVEERPAAVADEIAAAPMLELRPNPASVQTTIVYTRPEFGGTTRCEVLNALGTRVLELPLSATRSGQIDFVLDTTTLSSGVYTVRLTTARTSTERVLVITR